jgi:hypothetical protein
MIMPPSRQPNGSAQEAAQGIFSKQAPFLGAVIRAVAIASSFLAVSTAIGTPLAELQPEHSFVSFTTERTKVSSYLACTKSRMNQASGDLGALYSCIGGKAETVKIFISEMSNSGGRVKNVKFLWNDYTKDVGEGIHADAAIAKQWAGYLADMYAPNHKTHVLKVFLGNKSTVVESATHVLTYSYSKGPVANERMFVVTKK